MDLDIYFECKPCSWYNRYYWYTLVYSPHMDCHGSHGRIHKLHDYSRRDSKHCYHMGLDSKDYVVLARLGMLFEQLKEICVYDQ